MRQLGFREAGEGRGTTIVATKKDGQQTKRGKREQVARETPQDAEPGRRMTMIDPWSTLLAGLLEVPEEDGGTDEHGGEREEKGPAAQPEPERPKRRRGR